MQFGDTIMVLYTSSPIAEIIRASQQDLYYKDFNINWWGKKVFFRHNGLLLNFFHQGKMNFRESLRVPDDVIVIGDSGGYEILSNRAKGREIRIDPLQCLRWQEKNCQIGLTLDLSPVNLQTTGEQGKSVAANPLPISHTEFEKRLNKTCDHNEIFEAKRENKDLKIYNVIHSGMGKIDSMGIWFDRVKDFKFEGWSIAPKPPSDTMKIALDGMFLYDRGVKENLHVLGISGIKTLPILVYLEKFIKNVSTDSFSYGVNAIVRKHMRMMSHDLYFKPSERKHTKVPCICPVCREIEIDDMYRTDKVGYGLLSLHNKWTYLNYLKYLEALVEDEETFERFINRYPKLKKAIDFMRISADRGWDEAITRFGLKQSNLEKW